MSHLLDVKKDYKLGNVDEGQQRAKQGPYPNHSLTVNQPQHIGGNHKLLPTKWLNQLVGHVVHQHSEVKKQTTTLSCSAFTSNVMLPVTRWHSLPYLRGNSTRTSIARLMRRSNSVSLYISCPMCVSQHWETPQEWQGRFFFSHCFSPLPHTCLHLEVKVFLRVHAHGDSAICVFVI